MTERKRSPEQPTNTQRQHEEPYESTMNPETMGRGIGSGLGQGGADQHTTEEPEARGEGPISGSDRPAEQQGGPVASGASFAPDNVSSPMPVSGESDQWTTPGLGAEDDSNRSTTPLQMEPGRWTDPGVEGSSSSPVAAGTGGGAQTGSAETGREELGGTPNQASTTDRAGATGFADASDRRTTSGVGGLVDRGTERGSGTTGSGDGGGTASGFGSGSAQSSAERRKTTPLSGNLTQDTVE